MATSREHATAILTIDLDAIVDNWRLLATRARPAATAAVVKADAYGLGATEVARALRAAGVTTFFVACVDEGVALREAFAASEPDARHVEPTILVLNGVSAGGVDTLIARDLIPVLNSLGDVATWARAARARERRLPAALHVDTGMARLGLPAVEVERLAQDPSDLAAVDLRWILSHLACADTPAHPLNRQQLDRLRAALARLPKAAVSFANSAGIFLGADYRFDLTRPGAALYGVSPCADAPNPMRQVVRLQAKILQVREIDSPQSVGYGATHHAVGPERIATVGVGYADGYFRSLSNRGSGYLGDRRLPLVGRVSMDLITLDVSTLPAALAHPGALIDLIGPGQTVDDVAAAAGTIGYEVLTNLGHRYHRVYLGGRR